MHTHQVDIRTRRDARDLGVVARRNDVDHFTAVGRVERGCYDSSAEPGSDHGHLHWPNTSGASAPTARWKRRSATCVSGPTVSASSTVPTPTCPPSRNPTTRTVHSIDV